MDLRLLLIAVGFGTLGFVLGYLVSYQRTQGVRTLLEDILGDLSRYGVIAGESVIVMNRRIRDYRDRFAEIIKRIS